MPASIAPTKSVSGAGFVFEDKVVAFFLSFLLTDRPPLDPALGTISTLDFNVRADGWYLDDLLITLNVGTSKSRLAFSIKSNIQFAKSAAPADFVNTLWEQFLKVGSDKFNPDLDFLGMIQAPLPDGLGSHVQNLLALASGGNTTDLAARISAQNFTNDTVRSLLTSFHCPQAIAVSHGVTQNDTARLLSRLIVLEFDFDQQGSTRLAQAHENCRAALSSGNNDEAMTLWESLLALAADRRTKSGRLDRRALFDRLRARFGFKELPQHDADWARLAEQTQLVLSTLPTTIGPSLFLPMAKQRTVLHERLKTERMVLVLGPSGSGKTVLSRKVADDLAIESQCVWVAGSQFENSSFQDFEMSLGLGHSLAELFGNTTATRLHLFVDGVDRIYSEAGMHHLAMLIHLLDLSSADTPWHLLLSCPPEEWRRVQLLLLKYGISLPQEQIVTLDYPSDGDLEPVWTSFPELGALWLRPELRQLLRSPKILDLLARNITVLRATDTSTWIGESQFVDWFWATEVCAGPRAAARSAFVVSLATKQGDRIQPSIPKADFTADELQVFQELAVSRICKETAGRITFEHDLFGDWARLQSLIATSGSIIARLSSCVASPLWHRAIRLYGVYLVEHSPDTAAWEKALSDAAADTSCPVLCRDLILESILFAANAERKLEGCWPYLIAENALLFNRLLGRFLHVATVANPVMLAIANEMGADFSSEAETIDRYPFWPYWLPLLRVMSRHVPDCVKYAPDRTSQVAGSWLRFGGVDWPFRQQCAELALQVAEKLFVLHKCHNVYIKDNQLEPMYRSALSAYREMPDRVRQFSLLACSRRDLDQSNLLTNELLSHLVDELKIEVSFRVYENAPPPWPDGPTQRIDDAFQKVCLSTDALRPIMETDPALATEIILALLIEPPSEDHHFGSYDPIIDNLDIDNGHSMHLWYPPFYTRGPFLLFLRVNPQAGLDLIVRLANFASDRRADSIRRRRQEPFCVTFHIDEANTRTLHGGGDEYFWYADQAHCPDAVVSALMALEKYFYDRIDAKDDVSHQLQRMLLQSQSVAILGLASAIGRKQPELFSGPLRSILTVPESYQSEMSMLAQWDVHMQCAMMGWRSLGQTEEGRIEKMAREWHSMPHRRTDLRSVLCHLFIYNPACSEFLASLRARWEALLHHASDIAMPRESLEQLIAYLDRNNYRERTDEHNAKVVEYVPPVDLQKKAEEQSKQAQDRLLLLSLPLTCRRILVGAVSLDQQQVEALWSSVEYADKLPDFEDDQEGLLRKERVFCGIAAVLICKHRDWLARHPEEEKWCKDQILQVVSHLRPRSEMFSHSSTELDSEGFCAESIPVLWAEDLHNQKMREAVALLATAASHKTVELTFASCARLRDRLGNSFAQLQHLLLRASVLKWAAHELEREKYYLGTEKKRTVWRFISDWKRRFYMALANRSTPHFPHIQYNQFTARAIYLLKTTTRHFIKGSLQCSIPPWQVLITSINNRLGLHHDDPHRDRRDSGMDVGLVRAAYAWLPTLSLAKSDAERAEWISFWKQAVSLLVSSLGKPDADGEISGTPYESDRWVMDRISAVIMEMQQSERPEDLWMPILQLGPKAHYWIETFLDSLFIYGLNQEDLRDFDRVWRSMVYFAHQSKEWSFSHRLAFRVSDLWASLLGLSWVYRQSWDAAKRALVCAMKDDYHHYAKIAIPDRNDIKPLLYFFRTDAADSILLDGIEWLSSLVPYDNKYFWPEAQEDIVSFLDWAWTHKKDAIRQSESAFTAIRKLLQYLAGLQHPLALVLIEAVGTQSPGSPR